MTTPSNPATVSPVDTDIMNNLAAMYHRGHQSFHQIKFSMTLFNRHIYYNFLIIHRNYIASQPERGMTYYIYPMADKCILHCVGY